MTDSIAVSNFMAQGRIRLAWRLREAEWESVLRGEESLQWAGRYIARGDIEGASMAAKMASIYFRNGGDMARAEHWNMRARVWARGMVRLDIFKDTGAPIGWRMVEA